MKKILCAWMVAAALVPVGCSSGPQPVGGGTAETGDVRVAVVASASVSSQTRTGTIDLPEASIPDADAFALRITGTYENELGVEQSYEQSWASVGVFDSPKMVRGNYKAAVVYGSMEEEGAGAACFAGSQPFTIFARKTVSATVSATLQNAAFRVAFSEWFNRYYTDAKITIRTESDHSFTFTPANASVIFVKPSTKLFLKGTAVKAQTGTAVEFPEAEIGTTAARTLHTVAVDASQAGGGKLVVDLDDTFTELEEQVIELNPEA